MTLSDFSFTDRARPVVEIGTGDQRGTAGLSTWDSAHWDSTDAHWSSTEPTWHDVSCDVIRVETGYGRLATVERFLPGTATVLVDNTSGWADPSPLDELEPADPNDLTWSLTASQVLFLGDQLIWFPADATGVELRPGRQIRVGIVHETLGPVWLWRGFIDVMTPVYDPVQLDTVELSCIDALGEVNRAKSKPLPDAAFQGDRADIRIGRILDDAIWSTSKRDLMIAADTLAGSMMGGQTADLLAQAADSVGGAVFGDQTNTICFRTRDWQSYEPGAPPDGAIGNMETDPNDLTWSLTGSQVTWFADQLIWFETPPVVGPVRWERPFDRADIATRVIIGRDPITAVQIDDPAGIAKYGIEPFERTSLLNENDSRLELLAHRILEARGDSSVPRIRSVTLNAATSDDSLDMQATTDPFLPSRYRCRLREEDRGLVFDEMHFVTAIAHTIDRHNWETKINLDLAEPYSNAGDRWDDAYWDVSVWTQLVVTLTAVQARLLTMIGALSHA